MLNLSSSFTIKGKGLGEDVVKEEAQPRLVPLPAVAVKVVQPLGELGLRLGEAADVLVPPRPRKEDPPIDVASLQADHHLAVVVPGAVVGVDREEGGAELAAERQGRPHLQATVGEGDSGGDRGGGVVEVEHGGVASVQLQVAAGGEVGVGAVVARRLFDVVA